MVETRAKAAVADIKAGHMVILVDDENRENEGDLVCAATLITATKINFMAKEARGLICLSLPLAQIKRLGLQMMTQKGCIKNPRGTAFTNSIDARWGITTGISAFDRAQTIALACSDVVKPSDIVVPGHVFPLQARPDGVLERRGHTEGARDLVRLAGLPAGAVICEIMKDDGTMARLPDLQVFALKHELKIVHIEDIVQLRLTQNVGVGAAERENFDSHQQI